MIGALVGKLFESHRPAHVSPVPALSGPYGDLDAPLPVIGTQFQSGGIWAVDEIWERTRVSRGGYRLVLPVRHD